MSELLLKLEGIESEEMITTLLQQSGNETNLYDVINVSIIAGFIFAFLLIAVILLYNYYGKTLHLKEKESLNHADEITNLKKLNEELCQKLEVLEELRQKDIAKMAEMATRRRGYMECAEKMMGMLDDFEKKTSEPSDAELKWYKTTLVEVKNFLQHLQPRKRNVQFFQNETYNFCISHV